VIVNVLFGSKPCGMILFPCETRWWIVHANKMSVYANKMSVDTKVELRLSALSIGRILAPAETELKNVLYLSDTPRT